MKPAATTSNQSETLIKAHNLGVRRNDRWIVRHVDIHIKRNQLVYLIGGNGAGKSTIAKALLNLISINEGAVSRAPFCTVGYIPQKMPISPTLPLTLNRMMTLTNKFSPDSIRTALATVGLNRLGDPPVTSLSGGEFQRLMLARALISKPDLLVFDEPVQGIDIAGQKKLNALIVEIYREVGCGVLMISHDLGLVVDTADDVVVLVPHEYEDDMH